MSWRCTYCGQMNARWANECGRCDEARVDELQHSTNERQLRLRVRELHCIVRRWRAIALMCATILLACVIVIVLQFCKLP